MCGLRIVIYRNYCWEIKESKKVGSDVVICATHAFSMARARLNGGLIPYYFLQCPCYPYGTCI